MGCTDRYPNPYTVYFDPKCHKGVYWWSYTDFSGNGVEVPFEYLGMLIDGHIDGIKRNYKHYVDKWRENGFPRPFIRWNPKTQRWRMTGGFHFNDWATRDYLEKHGLK